MSFLELNPIKPTISYLICKFLRPLNLECIQKKERKKKISQDSHNNHSTKPLTTPYSNDGEFYMRISTTHVLLQMFKSNFLQAIEIIRLSCHAITWINVSCYVNACTNRDWVVLNLSGCLSSTPCFQSLKTISLFNEQDFVCSSLHVLFNAKINC